MSPENNIIPVRDKVDYGMSVSCSACSIVPAATLNRHPMATSKKVVYLTPANFDIAMQAPIYHVTEISMIIQAVDYRLANDAVADELTFLPALPKPPLKCTATMSSM